MCHLRYLSSRRRSVEGDYTRALYTSELTC
ncbi:hypothetical protein V6Z11_D11G237800 [Gossypium hirsutum]